MPILNCSREGCSEPRLEGSGFCRPHNPTPALVGRPLAKNVRATKIKIEFLVMGDGADEVKRFEEIFNTRIKLKVTSETVML